MTQQFYSLAYTQRKPYFKKIHSALFTIVRTWKQPKYPSTEEQIKKMWYIYIMEYYSTIKRNNCAFAEMQMDLETVIQCEVSQKIKYHIISLICGIQKNYTDELICKAQIETQTQRTDVRVPGVKGGRMRQEIGMNIYTLLCIKQITNQNVLCSTGNCTPTKINLKKKK